MVEHSCLQSLIEQVVELRLVGHEKVNTISDYWQRLTRRCATGALKGRCVLVRCRVVVPHSSLPHLLYNGQVPHNIGSA